MSNYERQHPPTLWNRVDDRFNYYRRHLSICRPNKRGSEIWDYTPLIPPY